MNQWVCCGRGIEPDHKKCCVRGCRRKPTLLCDFAIGPEETCSEPLCSVHAVKRATRRELDYCPKHAATDPNETVWRKLQDDVARDEKHAEEIAEATRQQWRNAQAKRKSDMLAKKRARKNKPKG